MNPVKTKLSTIFRSLVVIPKNATESYKHDGISKSQRLMLELGLIKQSNPGSFILLPLTMRSLDKLIKIVDEFMTKIHAQKVHFPSVTSSKLWKTSGRIETIGAELFRLTDRHDRRCILSPTHEESAVDLINSLSPLSYKAYPLLIYQISTKYRDEIKPRFGLIRSRQFLMKDLYSFDVSLEMALNTYGLVGNVYRDILERIGVDFVKAYGASGSMGGNLSHEFHYITAVGEDKLITCLNCHHTINIDLSEGKETCRKCNSNNIEIKTSIEVGHTFLLEDKYTKPFKAFYLNHTGTPEVLQMGSYGLGLTRIIAAAIEVLSKPNEIRWPVTIAPYTVVIISPKIGSKEERVSVQYTDLLYGMLDRMAGLSGDVVWDDRGSLTIGKRVLDAKRLGVPYIVVIGGRAAEEPPTFDVINVYTDEVLYLTVDGVAGYFDSVDLARGKRKMAGKCD